MAKYMDAAGIRALAESAKSYFAAIDDLASTNEIQERLTEILMQNQETFDTMASLLQIMLGRTSAAKIYSLYQDPTAYNLTSSMGMAVAPPVPIEVATLSCKNSSGIQYFPEAYIPYVTTLASAFSNAAQLKVVGNIYAGNCKSLAQAFYNAYRLLIVENIYAPECTDASYLFAGCSVLERIGRLDIGTPATVAGMFKLCTALKTVPEVDTSAATDLSYMFDGSAQIKRIEGISFKSAANISSIFNQMGANVEYAYLLDLGYTDVMPDLSALTKWGTGKAENLESLRYSLVESSCDRAAAGLPNLTMRPSQTSFALLSSEDVARIIAKGYTIFPK
ncbi:MAG: BspA family leucine-rich repeat surface protein [Muribaculaceae bacterium]|nr:BspA family leucine-rich repeat surface protein [Muribaculaceae bacterium]